MVPLESHTLRGKLTNHQYVLSASVHPPFPTIFEIQTFQHPSAYPRLPAKIPRTRRSSYIETLEALSTNLRPASNLQHSSIYLTHGVHGSCSKSTG